MKSNMVRKNQDHQRARQVDYIALSRDLVDAVQSGVYIVQSRKFVYVNPFFEKLTGYSSDELIGKRSLSLVFPKDRPRVKKKAIRALKSRRVIKPYEYRFCRKNGEIMWALERLSSIQYMGQRATLGSFMDINDRKQLEEELAQSEDKYRCILEQMYDGYYEVDLTGNFTFINAAVSRDLGYSSEEMVGKSYRLFTPEDDIKKLFVVFNEVYTCSEPNKGFSHKIRCKDGSILFVESSVDLRKNEQGELIGFTSVVRDVTERQKLEEALIQSEERYRTILEQMQDAYYEVDLAGNLNFINEAFSRNLGYSVDEMLKMNYRDYVQKEDIDRVYRAFNDVFRTGIPNMAFVYKIIKKDGDTAFVEVSIDLLRDKNGDAIGFRGISREVTERRKAEEALRESEEKYRLLVEVANEVIFVVQDLKIKFFNRRAIELSGYSEDELNDMPFANLIYKDDLEMIMKRHQRRLLGEPFDNVFSFRYVTKEGKIGWVDINTVLIDWKGSPATLSTLNDITERKQAEDALKRSEERYRTILAEMQDSYFEVDLKGNFTFVNDATCHALGLSRVELMGKNFRTLMPEGEDNKVFQAYNTVFKTGEPNKGFDFQVRREDGEVGFVESSVTLLKNEVGEATGFRCVGRDVTERKQFEQTLREMATHDHLTGLPNRILLQDRFSMAAALAHRKNARLAVMSLDLDRFKPINDTLGHNAGDEVLKAVAERLTGTIRASDTIARVGGDEFILVMLETNHVFDAKAVAQKILDSFREPLGITDQQINLTTSMGVAIFPEDGEDLENLTKKSDAALYYAKGHGRNQYKFFNDGDVWIGGTYKSTELA